MIPAQVMRQSSRSDLARKVQADCLTAASDVRSASMNVTDSADGQRAMTSLAREAERPVK